MADVLLSVGVKTGTLSDSIQKEIKTALGGSKELKVNIVASKQNLIDSIKSVGGSTGVQANITANKSTLTTSLKDILSSYAYTKGIKVDVDAKYLRKQVDAALKGAGKGNFDSSSSKTGGSKDSTASAEKEVNAALREQAALAQTTTRAYNELNKVRNAKKNISRGSDEYRNLEAQEKKLRETIDTYDKSTDNLQEYKTKLADTTKENARLVDSAKESDAYANSFSQRLQRFKMHLTTITSIVRAFQMLRMVIQPVVNAVTEVDTALTQLRIVTQENDTAITSYANNIMKVADQTAGSVKDLINSTTTFARLGYTLEQSTDLAKYTQMLENVGDIDESSATAAITAIVKAYGVETDELESVMDKLVDVGNHFPISVAEIAEGMNNAGSMLSVATGGNLDQSIAMLTAANTTIQNISKSSTGLRTIAARIRNVGTELDELGESMTEVEYDSIVKALTDNNVALTDSNGELRNTYDILLDLSQVWETLSENEQAALAKTLSGTRQQNVFTSLMTNFGEATGAMDRMASSEGALTEANDVYLNSVQAHIQQLKNAFVEFSQSTISAEMVGQFVEFAKVLLQAVSGVLKFIDAIGGLRTVIPLVVTLFAVFKGQAMAKSINVLIKQFSLFGKNAASALKSLIAGQLSATGSTAALTGAEEANVITTASMAIAEEGAGRAAQSMGAKIQAAAGIIGIIAMAISAVISIISGAIQQMQEFRKAAADMGVKAGENASSLISSYDKYVAMVKNGQTGTEEFASTQEELRESLGLTAAEFDNLVRSTTGYSDALKEAAIKQLDLDISTQKAGLRSQAQITQDEITNLLGYTLSNMPNIEATLGLIVDDPQMATNADYFIKNMDSIKEKLIELQRVSKDNDPTYKSLLTYYNQMSEATAEYAKQVNSLNQNIVHKSMLEIGRASVETTDEFNEYRDALTKAAIANGFFADSEEDARKAVDALLSATDGFEEFYSASEKAALGTTAIARGLQGVQDVTNGTSKAVAALDETLKADDYDTGMEKRIEYYKKLQEEVAGENWGGKHYKALAEYFGIDINQSVDEQIAAIERLSRYFTDSDQGMYNFLTDIGEKVPEAIAKFNAETGSLTWDSAELQAFADALGITRDTLIDMLDMYIQHTPPAEWMQFPPDEVAKWLEQDQVLQDLGDTLVLDRQKFNELADSAGVDADTLLASIMELSDYAGNNIIELSLDLQGAESAAQAAQNIRNFLADTAAYGLTAEQQIEAVAGSLSLLDEETIKSILIKLDLPENTQDKIVSFLSEQYGLNVDTSDTSANLEEVADGLTTVNIQMEKFNGSSVSASLEISGLATTEARLEHIQYMMQNMGATGGGRSTTVVGGHGGHQVRALGTRHAGAGLALLGDEFSASGRPKPELVVSNGQAYLAGVNGPVMHRLNAGDVVYSNKQTRRILGNNLDAISGIPAFSSGTSSRYWNKISGNASSLSSSSTYSGYYGTSSGSGSSGSSASSSGSGDNWFEQQYELHNHYRKLDQETDANYLTWLVGAWRQAYAEGIIELKDAHKYEEEAYELMKKIASERFKEEYDTHQHMVNLGQETDQEYYSWLEWRYKTAYANNEITLEEYWKYEEEVYKKSKDLVSDYFNDIDKKIDMLENAGKSDIEIIAWDVKGMEYAEKQIAELRKKGKDNNDSDVQEQQKNWWNYYNDRKKREEEIVKNAKDAEKDLVDYRVKMLKKDLDNEKDALNDRLSAIRDFYSEQKDLLQESRDEEKYLDEQAEKRKKVSDLELQLDQLRVDNSAWAQKKRLQLEQELFDARKELNEFERDHALDVTQKKLDDMQEMQEKAIEKEIENVEKASTSEADLYKQALGDVRNGGQDLYEAMVEFNNTEGSGNPADISEMWDEAYTSLKKYKDLFGEYYDDINLRYGTDTTPAVVDTSKIDAGYNPVEPKLAPQAPKKSTQAAAPVQQKAAAPAAKADPVTGTAVRLKSGAKLAYTSYDTPNLTPASWVFGRTLYVQAAYPGRNAPYHIGTTPNGYNNSATWVGFVNKAQLEGYASGTKSALAGIHEINERGDEALFKTADGSTYRLFSGGERVFNHEATGFLYDFANAPQRVLSQLLAGIGTGADIKNNTVSQNINMGDIIIQGGADQKTVSEIRREQRAQVDYMLKEFNRLNK